MKCPTCHSENPSDSRYCHRCGSAIQEAVSETLSYSPAQKAAIREMLKFSPGEKFGDRYTIIEEIGRGGMGRVYKAEDHELGTTVVLKMIRPELSSPHMVELFRKETLLGRSISHENVVRIHDIGVVDEIRYISMDFIKGENLAELIETSGSLTLAACLKIAIQICRALSAAHQRGIVHQDLKPHNILIDNSGRVYVSDFGLAESLYAPKAGAPTRVRGTPMYFSPEQARGEVPDRRSDIYSLGIILYEMMAGKAPFKADSVEGYIREHVSERPASPSRINPSIPPSFEKIILKCLEKKKENRYQTADELLQDLETQKKQARRPAAASKFKKWQAAVLTASLVLVLAIASLIFIPILWPPEGGPPGRTLVAVMYAVNNTGDKSLNDQLRWVIPYYLSTDLAQSKYLSILPQDRLMQLLSDLKQMEEERHLSRTLDRIAEAANVDYFVLPGFTKAGDNFLISLIVRKAKTDTAVGEPDVVKGKSFEDLLTMVDELSLRVKSRLNFTSAAIASDYNQKLDSITTSSLGAVRYYVEAERQYVLGDFKASVQALEKAVNEDPNYAIAYRKMAEDYDYLGEYDKHRIYLQKSLTLVDRVSERDRYLIQGYASSVLNESPLPAIASYKKLIELYPRDEEGYMLLGAIYRNLEEWDLAREQFHRALTLSPRNALVNMNNVFIDTCQGRYEEAVALCEANATAPPNDGFFLRQLSLLYLIQGQFDRASAELERARAVAPDSLDMLELQGNLRHLMGDAGRAGQLYEQLQYRGEATPDAPDLRGRKWLAHLHQLQGEYDQAQKEILAGIELARNANRFSDELDLRLLLADSELRQKHYQQAAEALKPTLELARKTTRASLQKLALNRLGLVSLGAGRIEYAKSIDQELRQLVERTGCPKHARYYLHLSGHIALAERHPEQAIQDFERAIGLVPSQRGIGDEQAFYYDSLATAYYQAGDRAKAAETYRRIISLTTGRLQWGDLYARSYYWLGKIQQMAGDGAGAAANYETFLRLWKHADEGLPEVVDSRKQLESLGKDF